MFKWYGYLGILSIILVEFNFYFKIQPFAKYYFIIVWLGYILLVDALVDHFSEDSMIMKRKRSLFGLFLLSAITWWIFELINLKIGRWDYNNYSGITALAGAARKTIYFSTVMPAIFETAELIRAIHIFDKTKLKEKFRVSKKLIYTIIATGIMAMFLTLTWPEYFHPLVWVFLFLILDPINYMNRQPSILGHLKDRNISAPLSLLLAGIICGFFWEFWNYWAITKWYYNIPYVGFFKVFEMPILGYLGYLPFALELYALYWFIRSLFLRKEKIIE